MSESDDLRQAYDALNRFINEAGDQVVVGTCLYAPNHVLEVLGLLPPERPVHRLHRLNRHERRKAMVQGRRP